MVKVTTALLKYFRNREHCRYLIVFLDKVEASTDIKTFLAAKLGPFKIELAREEALIQRMNKSEYTRIIAADDKRIDNCITGIREIITASMRHPTASIRDAAYSLKVRLDEYGRIERQSYESETLAVGMLLEDFASDTYAPKVTLLNLTAWVTELTAGKNAFLQTFALRQAESSAKPIGPVEPVRKIIDKQYRDMVADLDAASLLASVTGIDAFITALNVEIEYFNDNYANRTKKDLSEGTRTYIEDIETQQYSGVAITVVPTVFYRVEGEEDVRLELGKDFSLTYKNNIEPGTAEVIVTGKGAYKGNKVATFTIE
ncbi:MAG: DUF6261 family protein [Prevotellaceae bacterium]|jgi:hypothetical protein|nr:DUF6261 family protein [Prevotellaceae bacterium]